jgi:DNA-binding SARP family transcriptional activator
LKIGEENILRVHSRITGWKLFHQHWRERTNMDVINIFLFGIPRLEYQGKVLNVSRRKSMALVAYLAVTNRPQSRDRLIALFWPDLDEEHARSALRSTLYSLISQVPVEWILATRQTLHLNPERIGVDVHEFGRLQAQVRQHRHQDEQLCEHCTQALAACAALYQDDFLAGFGLSDSAEFDDWQVLQQEYLRQEMGNILRLLSHHYGNDTRKTYDEAFHYARRWLALNPLHEPAHRLLMHLYAASGHRTEALQQYQECVNLLDEELATLPERETIQLYEEIQATQKLFNEVALESPVFGILPPRPALMIGREKALRDVKSRLGVGSAGDHVPSITVIQGLPGIGKSTLVAALAHDRDIIRTFPDGVLWVSLGQTPNLNAELMIWGRVLRVIDPNATFDIQELTGVLAAALRDKQMLLIVDDIWNVEHAAPFKVAGQKSTLVITTRLPDIAHSLISSTRDIYHLDVLDVDSGMNLLHALIPDVVKAYPKEAAELVRSLEGLPLAIQVAGRLILNEMQFGWGIQELLQELREGTRLLSAEIPGNMIVFSQGSGSTIAALLRRSTDVLDDFTRQRFADLGLFVPKPATFDLKAVTALWEIPDPKPVIRVLVNRGLLEPLSNGRFQIHALLVLHARSLWES